MTGPRTLTIAGGGARADLAPALGGAVLFFGDRRGPLLRAGAAAAVAADPRAAAIFPCVPWFGRIKRDLAAQGRAATLRATLPDASPLPLHGDGWISPWTVVEHDLDRLVCRLGVPPSPSRFPFAYSARQEFRIEGAALCIALSLRNEDDVPMPAGLGLHPYFVRTRSTRVSFSSTAFWTPPGSSPGRLSALPSALGGGAPAELPGDTLDHSFPGFTGEAIIHDGQEAVRILSGAPILHVYAPSGEAFFCLEPVTHLPGEFLGASADCGARLLAPGEEMSLRLVIDRPF